MNIIWMRQLWCVKMNEAKASQSKRDIICVSVCVSLPVIGPNTKWDGVISRCWSNMVRKSAHRQWYCMSMRLRRLTWDPDHALITLKWTNFEKKKVSWTFIYIDLNYFSPRGFNTHTKWKQKSVSASPSLSPPPPPSDRDFALLVWRCSEKKKKKRGKEK